MSYDSFEDQYEHYENQFRQKNGNRQQRRARKPKARHQPKKAYKDIIEAVVDDSPVELGIETTYQPGRFEEGWLTESLRPLFEQALIIDVLARLKGGKEASVYRCEAHPAVGARFMAAKVYRPRMFRNLRNDAMYREGRSIIGETGKEIKENEHRVMRALSKKTGFGDQVAHTSWLMHEMTTLKTLYDAGASVPKPYGSSLNVIGMDYIGDEYMAAPPLNSVTLESSERDTLFAQTLRNIEIMLQHGVIHGDLSAFNILYWEGRITLIDFPQVVSLHRNSRAISILERDVERICEYFAGQGVTSAGNIPCDPAAIMSRLRKRYFSRQRLNTEADYSRFQVEDE